MQPKRQTNRFFVYAAIFFLLKADFILDGVFNLKKERRFLGETAVSTGLTTGYSQIYKNQLN